MASPPVLSEERLLEIYLAWVQSGKIDGWIAMCESIAREAADAALADLAHHAGLATGPGDTYADMRDEIVRGVQQARREAAVGALREAEVIATGLVVGQPKAYRWHKQIHASGHDKACHGIARRIRARAKEIAGE